MSDKIDLILEQLQQLNSRLSTVENNMATKEDVQSINDHLDRIELAVNRIEANEPADVMALLKQIDRKIDIEIKNTLNDHDADIKLIKRVLTNQ